MLLCHPAGQPHLLHYAMEPHLCTWCVHCAGPSAGCWTQPHGKLSLRHTLTKSKVIEMQELLAQ